MQLSLSYRRDIERPPYANLTSSTVYINRYTYQSGNPYLLPTYTHSLVLNVAYQWANLTLNYGRIKNALTMSTELYPGSADPLISLVRPINSEDDYDRLSIIAAARPNVQFSMFNAQCQWHPTWTVVAMLQNYKSPTATGEVVTLSQPWFNGSWRNTIELPHALRLDVNFDWATKGEYNNYRITKPRFVGSFGIQKDISLRRLGELTADLRCIDLFNTNKAEATIYGMRELSTTILPAAPSCSTSRGSSTRPVRSIAVLVPATSRRHACNSMINQVKEKKQWNRNFVRAAECRSPMMSSAPMPTGVRTKIFACTATEKDASCRTAPWRR